jgi:hypothetical protein
LTAEARQKLIRPSMVDQDDNSMLCYWIFRMFETFQSSLAYEIGYVRSARTHARDRHVYVVNLRAQ